MHEFSIMQGLFNIIEEVAAQNKLRRIHVVRLKIGKMRQVYPEFLEFAFEQLAAGTIAEGAELHIESIPIRMSCSACGDEFEVAHNTYVCPQCGAHSLVLLSGKEVFLENIEGEQ